MIRMLKDKCTKCKVCMNICPSKIIREGKDTYPVISKRVESFCIKCGHCYAVCPVGAVEYEGKVADSVSDDIGTLESIDHIIMQRRSIRHYKEVEVQREVLENLLDLLRYTPSGSNARPVEYTVVSGKDKTDMVANIAVEWAKEMNQFTELIPEMRRGNNLITCGAPHLIIAHGQSEKSTPLEDSVIALATLELASSAKGIGTCWAGYLTSIANRSKQIKEFMHIQETHTIRGIIMMGYPKIKFFRRPIRARENITWV